MKCLEILQFLRQKCHQCFKKKKLHQERDGLKQSLVELNELKELREHDKIQAAAQADKNIFIKKENSVVIVEVTSEPDQEDNQTSPAGDNIPIHPMLNKKEYSFKEEEFESIDSHHQPEKQNVVGSTKRLVDQLQRIKKRKSSRDDSLRRSQSYYSSQVEETPSADKINVTAETEKLREWVKQEYGKTKYASFRISHAVRLRMHGQAMTNHILHKLEDFRANYLYQSAENSGFFFINKSKTLEAEYHHDQVSSHIRKQKVTSYIKMKCFTSKVTPILQILNSKKTLKVFHGFPLTKAVEYEGGSLGLSLPILEMCRGGRRSRETLVYHVASQVSEVYEKEPGRRVAQVSYSLDDGEDSWQRVVKILVGLVGEVQVYWESFEEIADDMQNVFRNNFLGIQKFCSDIKMIPLD